MTRKTIMWIEDDTELIDPVVKPLERDGHNIVRLHTVQEALAAVEQIRQADLILLDIVLPEGDDQREGDFEKYTKLGFDLLKDLRQQHGVLTPVVVFSVRSDQSELEADFRGLGNVLDYVRKPVLPSTLKARIEKALHVAN